MRHLEMIALQRFRDAFPGRGDDELRELRQNLYLLAGMLIDQLVDEHQVKQSLPMHGGDDHGQVDPIERSLPT